MITTSNKSPATLSAPAGRLRNPGMPLELGWVKQAQVNKSAVERRTSTLSTRRTVKNQWQAMNN
jgi:hypothetical protein